MFAWEPKLEAKIKKYLDGYPACHDYYHLKRVRQNAERLSEEFDCDKEILFAAAWLHDIGYKDHEDDDKNHFKYSMEIAKDWLTEIGFTIEKLDQVLEAIKLHDIFAWGYGGAQTDHLETKILQDADCIDMIGAIGVVRHAYYYGERAYPIYSDKPMPSDSETQVWINHSLLDQMSRDTLKKWENLNFDSSRKLAQKRQEFLLNFYEELKSELNLGDDL